MGAATVVGEDLEAMADDGDRTVGTRRGTTAVPPGETRPVQRAITELLGRVRTVAGPEAAGLFFGDPPDVVLIAEEPVNYRDTVEFKFKGFARGARPDRAQPVIIRITGEKKEDFSSAYTLELTNARDRRFRKGAFETRLFPVPPAALEDLLGLHRFLYEKQSADRIVEVNDFLLGTPELRRYAWDSFSGPKATAPRRPGKRGRAAQPRSTPPR